jgi:hypothetical protein
MNPWKSLIDPQWMFRAIFLGASLTFLILGGCELEDSADDSDDAEEVTYSDIQVEFFFEASDAAIPSKEVNENPEPENPDSEQINPNDVRVEPSSYAQIYDARGIQALSCTVAEDGEETYYSCNENFFSGLTLSEGDFDGSEFSWEDTDGNTRRVAFTSLVPMTPGQEVDVFNNESLDTTSFTTTELAIGGLMLNVIAETATVPTSTQDAELFLCKSTTCQEDLSLFASLSADVNMGTELWNLDADDIFGTIATDPDANGVEGTELDENYSFMDTSISEDKDITELRQLSIVEYVSAYDDSPATYWQAYLVPIGALSEGEELSTDVIELSDGLNLTITFSNFVIEMTDETFTPEDEVAPFFALPHTTLNVSE